MNVPGLVDRAPHWLGLSLALFAVGMAAPQFEPAHAVVEESFRPDGGAAGVRRFWGFIENQGQWSTDARFVADCGGLRVRAEPGAIVLQTNERRRVGVVRLAFESGAEAVPRAGSRSRGEFHYLLGDEPARWYRHVPAYLDLVYPDVSPGTDVRLHQRDGRFEYDVVLSPSAAVEDFIVRCEGIEGLTIEANGDLRMDTSLGPLVQPAPVAWQLDASGQTTPATCSFRILDPQRYGLSVPSRTSGSTLVIDPGLIWASYLGGSGLDDERGVEVLPNGDILVMGRSISPDFPTTAGVFETPSSESDVTVTCVKPAGDELVFSTRFGGSTIEVPLALDVADDGRIAVGGYTNSTDYPTLLDGYDGTFNGFIDGFISVLAPDGSELNLSTLIGGSSGESVVGIAFTSRGQVVAAGATSSPNFPSTPNGFDSSNGGSSEGFILWLDPTLSGAAQLVSGSFLGGALYDEVFALTLGPNDEPIVVGRADSPDYPTTPGAYDETPGGDFLTRISADGSAIVASTRFKDGVLYEVTSDGDTVLFSGRTGFTLPVSSNAFDKSYSGLGDSFVARIDGQLSRLLAATYIGGSGSDSIAKVVVDQAGIIVLAGTTASPDYPVTPGAYDTVKEGGLDLHTSMVSYVSPDLSHVLYGSFLGPSPGGGASDVAVLGVADVVMVGGLATSEFPVTPGAFDTTYGAGALGDGYVARMSLGPLPWGYYGGSIEGSAGTPLLAGTGDLVAGTPVRLTLSKAKAATPVTLVVGVSELSAPFKGGTLVPNPDLLIAGLATTAHGTLTLVSTWPSGLPSGFTFYSQYWIADPAGPAGFAASNGLSGTTP